MEESRESRAWARDESPTWVWGLVAAALLVGTGLRFYWAISLPFNFAPDESCHYAMAEYLAREGRLPTMADVPDRIPVSYPALCPLGYLPSAMTLSLASPENLHVHRYARLGSVLMGAATLALAFLAARRLFPDHPIISLAVVWSMALHPQLVFINAYVNNDSAMILACGAVWYLWMIVAREGMSAARGLALGALAGLALLTKLNALGVALAGAPIIATAIFAGAAPSSRDGGRRMELLLSLGRGLFFLALATLSAFVVCAPWLWWSWSHHRSLWGVEIHQQWWFDFLARHHVVQGFLTRDRLGDFLFGTWKSFWACFGYCSVWLSSRTYQRLTLAIALAPLALAVRTVRHFMGIEKTLLPTSTSKAVDARPSSAASPDPRRLVAALTTLALGIALVGAAHVHHSRSYGLSPQGRYLMPAVWAIMTLLAAGGASLGRGPRSSAAGALALVLLMGWLQGKSIEAERRSERLPQPDRRVKSHLLAYVAPLPARRGTCPTGIKPAGTAMTATSNGLCRLVCASGEDGLRIGPVDAERAQWLIIEQQREEGAWKGGSVSLLVNGALGGETVPYGHAGNGVFRYRFDLRSLERPTGGAAVELLFRPGDGPSQVLLRRIEIHDRQGRRVVIGEPNFPTLSERSPLKTRDQRLRKAPHG